MFDNDRKVLGMKCERADHFRGLMGYYRQMRFVVPVLLLLVGALSTQDDRMQVPNAPVTMMATSKFTEDEEYQLKSTRGSASIKSARSYVSDYEDTLSIMATVTEFGGMKLTRDRLRFSFASTVWDYEVDTEDKQEILEEKETSFGPAPAFYLKMKVKPKDEEDYLFEAYMVSINNKEVFLTAVYYDTDEGKAGVKAWTNSIEVDGKKRGDMKDIKDDE